MRNKNNNYVSRRVFPKSGTFGTSGTFTNVLAGNHRFVAVPQSGTFEVSSGTFGTFEPLKVPLRAKNQCLVFSSIGDLYPSKTHLDTPHG